MEKLRYILAEWFENSAPAYLTRDIPGDLFDNRHILSLAGVRRSGKTFIFYQIIDQLKKTIPLSNIIYIDFEDDRLLPIEGTEIKELLNVYRQHFPLNKDYPVYLFLDEVQNIPNWDKSVRRIFDREQNVQLAITGSSSKLLSSEIATALRGRTLSHYVAPVTFREFLRFKNVQVSDLNNIFFSPQKNELIKLFNEYLEFGGLPQVVLSEKKLPILQEYFRAIFYRDIIERYNIRKIKLFENFIKLLIQSMSSRFSFGKMSHTLASIGHKVSKATLVDYMEKIESAFLAFQVPIFSFNIKDQLQYPRKIYIIDNGIRNAVTFRFSQDRGRLLENLVFKHLYRQSQNDIYYWADKNGHEVDFVVKQGTNVIKLIQVCESLADPKTRGRELRALDKAMAELDTDSATILTDDELHIEKVADKHITIKPIWLWLLENEFQTKYDKPDSN
jgi:predicted AAA+ superfamily ATPase